ncbi:hypothetical protein F5Y11DRAFT_145592 [Daldinia sp. FL1419]|nr:hypothetical protein F5Y11DRAFT_145592 [Daldinia sp. FL1419]
MVPSLYLQKSDRVVKSPPPFFAVTASKKVIPKVIHGHITDAYTCTRRDNFSFFYLYYQVPSRSFFFYFCNPFLSFPLLSVGYRRIQYTVYRHRLYLLGSIFLRLKSNQTSSPLVIRLGILHLFEIIAVHLIGRLTTTRRIRDDRILCPVI